MATARPTKPATEKVASARSYVDLAAELAADVRAMAERMRDELADIEQRCSTINETSPEPGDYAAADGVRRIPMSTSDVHRALEGLAHAAADLATKAVRTEQG